MKGRVKFESLIEKNDNCEENERTNCYNKGKVYRAIKTKWLRNKEEIQRERDRDAHSVIERKDFHTRQREKERGKKRERDSNKCHSIDFSSWSVGQKQHNRSQLSGLSLSLYFSLSLLYSHLYTCTHITISTYQSDV